MTIRLEYRTTLKKVNIYIYIKFYLIFEIYICGKIQIWKRHILHPKLPKT